MDELSLHILDIAQNSLAAGARLVTVEIAEDCAKDTLAITICDDGCGMSAEMLAVATDPFVTGRKTRRVGLGLPLFKLAAEMTGGGLEILSREGVGTQVRAVFGLSHIDRKPLGDIAATVRQLITTNEEIDFVYRHSVGEMSYTLDTRELRKISDGLPLSNAEAALWLESFIRENEDELVK